MRRPRPTGGGGVLGPPKKQKPIISHAVAQLVEALRFKPEGCGFDSRL